jgi:hypothetical protein
MKIGLRRLLMLFCQAATSELRGLNSMRIRTHSILVAMQRYRCCREINGHIAATK